MASWAEGEFVGGRRSSPPYGEGLSTVLPTTTQTWRKTLQDYDYEQDMGLWCDRWKERPFSGAEWGKNPEDSKQKTSQIRPLPSKCLNPLDFLVFSSLYASHTDTQRRLSIEARGKKAHLGKGVSH